MICVSLAEPTAAHCLRALQSLDFAEIRLDRMRIGPVGIKKIFSQPARLIASCRPGGRSEEKRLHLLLTAIQAGAAFVDVELETAARFRERVIRAARAVGCRVIVSSHNFERTPPRAELERTIALSLAAGADIVKVACLVRSRRDNARLLGLLDAGASLIVVGMGKKGRLTRLVAPLLGSAFTYASIGGGRETAEGQWEAASLERILLELKHYAQG
jgi:3-dehydroquinate dehydratase type I